MINSNAGREQVEQEVEQVEILCANVMEDTPTDYEIVISESRQQLRVAGPTTSKTYGSPIPTKALSPVFGVWSTYLAAFPKH